jgi:hypothetical protein
VHDRWHGRYPGQRGPHPPPLPACAPAVCGVPPLARRGLYFRTGSLI